MMKYDMHSRSKEIIHQFIFNKKLFKPHPVTEYDMQPQSKEMIHRSSVKKIVQCAPGGVV